MRLDFKGARILRQEIFSVGVWNGMKFTKEDLLDIEKSFNELKDTLNIPLKLGHDEKQVLTDGLPAIGWVQSVEFNEKTEKLEAEFAIVSEAVQKAIDMEMYRSVSIELDVGVTYKDKEFNFVLTGVALLGAELPAVNNLNDLGKFDRKAFSKVGKTLHFNLKQGDNMDLEKKVEELERKLEAQADTIKLSKEKTDELTTENAALKTENEQHKEAAKKAAFTTAKTSIESTLEKMVKANKLLPAVREQFCKDITEDNIESKQQAAEMMFSSMMGKDEKAFDAEEEGKKKDHDKVEMSADKALDLEAKKIMRDKNIKYTEALEFAKQARPDLVQEWMDQDGYNTHAA